ncbi:MAG: DUF2206 domain-containing protein [Halapricum sp.]
MKLGERITVAEWAHAFDGDRTLSVEATTVLRGAIAFYAFSVAAMALAHVLPNVFTVPFVVLSLSFVPGVLVLLALDRENVTVGAAHLLYAFGTSLVVLMFVGAASNVVLPYAGVTKPLMPVPLAASVTAAVGLLAVVAHWRGPRQSITLRIPPLWSPIPLALLATPLLAALGVNLLNATGHNGLLLVVLLAAAAVPVLVVRGFDERWHSLAIWSIALAILYHKTLWQYAGFGGRPHGITAWEAGRWSPGVTSIEPYTSELLQNGVLFPLFARLSDLFIMTQYEVVNPFFVSFIPLAMFVTFRRYVSADTAFLGAALFVFSHPFYYQYPTAGRAATPVIFLTLFGVALSNDELPSGSRGLLSVLFLLGIVVTHYGTSYYVAVAFVLAVVLLYAVRTVDRMAHTWFGRPVAATDGDASTAGPGEGIRRETIFSVTTVFFFFTAALGWYFYARGGWKFEILPKFATENLVTLLSSGTETGRTAARVTESYSSLSIEISKYIYILLAMLILLGLAVAYYRRVVDGTCSFDDSYLAIAAALFAIFGTTVVLYNWGGGRPLMITFSFTTVFAAVGTVWIAQRAVRVSTGLNRRLPLPAGTSGAVDRRIPDGDSFGKAAFAGMLMVFLLLNTGVAAATVFDGLAPSNVPAQPMLLDNRGPDSQVTVHRETDIVTHVWVVEHLDEDYQVYGDTFGARQYDWYRPDIAARTPELGGGYSRETKPGVLNVARQRAGTQPGYILVMGHNVELDAFWPSKFEPSVPTSDVSVDRRNRIYTNGESQVYFYTDSHPSTRDETAESDQQ